jgi:hypothetical protein
MAERPSRSVLERNRTPLCCRTCRGANVAHTLGGMNKPLVCACLLLLMINSRARAEDEKKLSSPDGQWRFEIADGQFPEIHRTGKTEPALDLTENDRSVPHADSAEVVWAPDSKRFAFNYSPPTASHSTFVMTAFYQLRGDEWVLLHSPIVEDSQKKSFAELAKHLPKGVKPPRLWHGDPNRLTFKVRNWPDPDTAILYVYTAGTSSGGSDSPSAFIFTLKFDPEGKCKITDSQKVAQKTSKTRSLVPKTAQNQSCLTEQNPTAV